MTWNAGSTAMLLPNLYPLLVLFACEDSKKIAIFVSFCKYRMTKTISDQMGQIYLMFNQSLIFMGY